MVKTLAPIDVVMKLPFFSSVLAFLAEAHDIPDDRAEGLDRIRIVIRDADNWKQALRVWARAQDYQREHQQHHNEADTAREEDREAAAAAAAAYMSFTERVVHHYDSFVFKFRGSALRDGVHHGFKKMEIYVVAGDAVTEVFGKERAIVSLLDYELEVCICHGCVLCVCMVYLLLIYEHIGIGNRIEQSSTRRSRAG